MGRFLVRIDSRVRHQGLCSIELNPVKNPALFPFWDLQGLWSTEELSTPSKATFDMLCMLVLILSVCVSTDDNMSLLETPEVEILSLSSLLSWTRTCVDCLKFKLAASLTLLLLDNGVCDILLWLIELGCVIEALLQVV